MQPNMQQIPQQQMMNPNPQILMENPQQIPINQQLFQVVQSDSTPNRCEKFSKWLTGSYNVPLVVFLILMGSSLYFILSLIITSFFPFGFMAYSAFANFLFALFVWGPMAIKIEKNTSTVRYGCLYLINNSLLSLCTLCCPLSLQTIWCFILFETLLIALSNKTKKMRFFCCKLSGNAVIACSIIYSFIFNSYYFFSLIVTVVYTLVYQKYLMKKFAISNEKVERMENWCCISGLKNKLSTFITLKEVLEKGQQKQPLVQNSNVSNNSSFVPINMYPNYFSGIAPGMQQMQPMEQMAQAEGINSVNSNANLQ